MSQEAYSYSSTGALFRGHRDATEPARGIRSAREGSVHPSSRPYPRASLQLALPQNGPEMGAGAEIAITARLLTPARRGRLAARVGVSEVMETQRGEFAEFVVEGRDSRDPASGGGRWRLPPCVWARGNRPPGQRTGNGPENALGRRGKPYPAGGRTRPQ
jgi:hypothetical protein